MAKYVLWCPGESVHCAPDIAIDTETELIVDHTIPNVVLMQVYDGNIVHLVEWPDIPGYLNELNTWNPKGRFIFHNAAFDMAVLGYPEFLIKAVDEGRIVDTMLRFVLMQIERQGYLTKRSLKYVCKHVLNREIDKNEDIRLTFSRSEDPSTAHLEYAADDPVHTYDIAMKLEYQATEDVQVKGAIALDYISRLGLRVDESERSRLETKFQTALYDCLLIMEDNGFIPGQKGNQLVMQQYMEDLEFKYNIKLPRTVKTNKIKTGQEVLDGLDITDPFLDAYSKQAHLNKMIKTYLGEDVIGKDGRVHTRFNSCVVTGRTSSSKPNCQNLPKAEGLRGIFIPTEGHWFNASDYSQVELCALAQDTLIKQGKSVLADKINEGIDCHKYLGSFIFSKDEDKITKSERQKSKIPNFGFPGGLSAKTFVQYAKGFGLTVSYMEAEHMRNMWLKAFPEMKEHLCPEQQLEYPGKYISKTLTGRIRGMCSYTESCNNSFQSLASDGAKEALWLMFKERIRTVAFIHDETINEIKITNPQQMSEEVGHVEELMIKGMTKVIPDVAIRTESVLMDRWYKEAEPIHNEQGFLLKWDPPQQ